MNKLTKAQLIVGCAYIGILVWGHAVASRNQTTAFSKLKPNPEKFSFPMTDAGDIPVMTFVYVKEIGRPQLITIPDIGEFIVKHKS